MKNKKQRWRNLCPVRQMGIQYERKIKRKIQLQCLIYLSNQTFRKRKRMG